MTKPTIIDENGNGDSGDSRRAFVDALDPTKNVLDIIRAESKYQDGMREAVQRLNEFSLAAESRLQTFARESESKMQTWMRDAETSRLDQLSDLRQTYESRIADMLSESVKSTSSLVSTQLVQIQSTFDARVSKLEEFRLLSTGRSSVADPQLASSLSMLSNGITDMQKAFNKTLEELTAKQTKAMEELARNVASLKTSGTADEGRLMGRSDIGKWIVSALIAGSAFAAILGFILKFVGTVHSICAALVGPIRYNTFTKTSGRYAGPILGIDLKQRNQIGQRLGCPQYRARAAAPAADYGRKF